VVALPPPPPPQAAIKIKAKKVELGTFFNNMIIYGFKFKKIYSTLDSI
jgi:hypothetical protein